MGIEILHIPDSRKSPKLTFFIKAVYKQVRGNCLIKLNLGIKSEPVKSNGGR